MTNSNMLQDPADIRSIDELLDGLDDAYDILDDSDLLDDILKYNSPEDSPEDFEDF